MPDESKVVVNFRMDPDEHAKLEQEANDRGLSLSAYLRQIIHDRHKQPQLEQRVERLEQEVRVLQQHVTDGQRLPP